MQINQRGPLNTIGKGMAGGLSRVAAGRFTARYTRLAETYISILLGKGAGSGWAMNSELAAARTALESAVDHDAPLTIFDVGANNGNWSSEVKSMFPNAKMFLFEPQQSCIDKLEKRFAGQVTIVPNAVSSSDGEPVQLYVNSSNEEIASLHSRNDSYFKELSFDTQQTSTLTIDSFVARNHIDKVDLLKIDVEGHDLMALQGATECMANGTIRALTFEFGSGNINSRTFFRDFWELLEPQGYHMYRILPSGKLLHVPAYYEDCEYFRGVTNYLATLAPL